MNQNKKTKSVTRIFALLLSVMLGLGLVGCGEGKADSNALPGADSCRGKVTVMGEGESSFHFNVTDVEGKTTCFEIHTDAESVGEALMALELIQGEQGDYGIYVKTVNGTTLDYEKDGKYWAFYIGAEYGLTGAEQTDITAGEIYTFKAE